MIEEIVLGNRDKIYTLTSDCVIHLHDLLGKNYHLVDKMDPVEPPGIKSINILESAIFRQKTGSKGWLKYDNPFRNCATLMFGLIKNHPFHNGNKRVAFLSMIKHLFENGYVIRPETKHDDIYNILLSIADNDFENRLYNVDRKLYRQFKSKEKWDDDKVIEILSVWLRKISESKNYCLKSQVKVNQITEMLKKKGIHAEINGTRLTLFQLREKKLLGFIPTKNERYNDKTYFMGNSLTEVGVRVISQIRKDYELTQKDGFDNHSFYDTETFIDQEMVTYKRIIYKLSQT